VGIVKKGGGRSRKGGDLKRGEEVLGTVSRKGGVPSFMRKTWKTNKGKIIDGEDREISRGVLG